MHMVYTRPVLRGHGLVAYLHPRTLPTHTHTHTHAQHATTPTYTQSLSIIHTRTFTHSLTRSFHLTHKLTLPPSKARTQSHPPTTILCHTHTRAFFLHHRPTPMIRNGAKYIRVGKMAEHRALSKYNENLAYNCGLKYQSNVTRLLV